MLQFGWPIGMPLVRKLVDRIWELRSSLPSRREARVLFTANEHQIVILSAFIKKAQKTPVSEIELARTRLKELRK
jgi:phage-related protein